VRLLVAAKTPTPWFQVSADGVVSAVALDTVPSDVLTRKSGVDCASILK
jgi:hypothetical protein